MRCSISFDAKSAAHNRSVRLFVLGRVIAAACVAVVIVPSVSLAQIRAQLLATGFSSPLQLVQDPLAPDVVYIVEQGGVVQALRGGSRLEPFIDLRESISTGGERGLLGMAFDPNVASGRVFFNFTNANGDTVVARFRRSPVNPLRADPASRFDLRWPSGERVIRQPFANHNGGNLVFGPDGYLYIGLGDGGSGNDPQNNAQNPASLLGKMLRVDVSVDDADSTGYRIPPDNPFVDGQPTAALPEIWDFGLRNPWRYSFDDVGAGATGALIIADVGQTAREEINYEPFLAGGRNYGWRIREGTIPTPGVPATTPAFVPLIGPIFDYPRSVGQAITGGYVYRGTALGSPYFGRYFFADFATSRVWSLGLAINAAGEATAANLVEHTAEIGGNLNGIASFGRDAAGELYLLTFSGRVLKLVSSVATEPPANLTSSISGSTVVLSWAAPAGAAPTAYRLEAGTTPGGSNVGVVSAPNTQTTLTFTNVPPGTYYARVRSVTSGGDSPPSNEAVIVVGAGGCSPPAAPTQFASVVNGRIVTLSWALAVGSASTLQIEAGSHAGAGDLAVITVEGSSRGLQVQAPPGVYFARLRAANACGISAASHEIVVTVF
jgi:glucose/arabinose dehydrogenase